MNHNFFKGHHSIAMRKYLIEHTPEFHESLKVRTAAAAVVNASDTCSLSCPHCLYAAALVKKKTIAPPEVTLEQAARFIEIMNQAGLEHLIFSGGGESYENLPVMCYMLENLVNLKQVVTVTSAYFATSVEQTSKVFDLLMSAIQRGNAKHGRDTVSFILRLSYDNSHNVPTDSIVFAVKHSLENSYSGVNMEIVIRTLLDPLENKDLLLAERLNGQVVPQKDPQNATTGMPIIDGFPTRWIAISDTSIPVIYKPTYFEGLSYKSKRNVIPGTSWQEIKAVEEEFDNFFNLSLRGKHGEGHNYYQTILKGYGFWLHTLYGVLHYNTPKSQADKGYSIYLPADGRLIVNASAPDSYVPVMSVSSWQHFLDMQARDILQYNAITYATDRLITLAREVEPNIDEIINRRNFVFSLAYTSMETPSLRLYLMIRMLQQFGSEMHANFTDQIVQEIVNTSKQDLIIAYQNSGNTLSTIEPKQSLFRDPIIGNETSVYI